MYAMMLVKGADAKLPDQREIMLEGAAPQLERWGDKLTQAMTMTDQEADAISEAISNGVLIGDPQFPQVKGIQLDPQADADLIAAIKKKGEDGPHFIDGLMDFAKYAKKRRQNLPHPQTCLLYTSPSPRDRTRSRMPSSA